MNGLKISLNADNVTEILGYYHHEISQHTNDINILKQHIQTLLEENQKSDTKSSTQKSNSDQNFSFFIENCNARLESFAASIKSLSKQMVLLDESSQKLKDYFDSTISSFQSHIENIEKSIQQTKTDSTETNSYSPHSPKNKKKECKAKSSIKKRRIANQREKSNSRISSPRKGRNEENENLNDSDDLELDNSDDNQKQYEAIVNDISTIKFSIDEIMKNSKNDRESIQSMINSFSGRLENFVTIKELETAITSQLEKSRLAIAQPAALVNNGQKRSIQTPRRKVHVTLINGEALSGERRQIQTQSIRCSASINPNYNNNQNNFTYASSGSSRTILSNTHGGGCCTPLQYH